MSQREPPPANKSPGARFTASPTSGEAPLNVSFNASASYDLDGSITSYVWTFGDGGSSSGATAAHTYTSAGTYTARLRVTDNDGATDTTTKTILVTPPPIAIVEVTEWTQDYYSYSGEYGNVYVYFKVTNVGTVHIDYYQVWIEITCADGSKYQEWTNGLDVPVGSYLTDYTIISTSRKQAVSASITNYELTSY